MSLLSKISLMITPNAVKPGKIYSYEPSDGSGDGDFSRASTATRVNSSGLIEDVATNIARIDYPTNGSCPHLLFEPQSTNLLTYSEDFSGYSKSSINIVSNISTSPDGGINATSVTNTSTGQSHIKTSFTASSTGDYTGSSYIKKQDFDFIYVEFGNAYAWFNISNGTLGNSGNFGSGWTFVSHSIESVGNDWYRISITANNTITGGYNFRPYQPTSANGNYTSGSLGSSFIWGTQIETGSYATSYIPTNGSAVTRVKDVATDFGDVNTFNSEEGVLFVEMARPLILDTYSLLSINNYFSNSDNNTVTVGFEGGGDLYIRLKANGSEIFKSNNLTSTADFYKIAISYKSDSSIIYINGNPIIPNQGNLLGNFSFSEALDNLSFDYNGNNVLPFYGKVKQVQVYKEALTDSELEYLTTFRYKTFTGLASGLNYNII